MSQILSSQGKNAPSNPYPHYLVRLATSSNFKDCKCFHGILEGFGVFDFLFLLLGGVLGLCGSGSPEGVFENISNIPWIFSSPHLGIWFFPADFVAILWNFGGLFPEQNKSREKTEMKRDPW